MPGSGVVATHPLTHCRPATRSQAVSPASGSLKHRTMPFQQPSAGAVPLETAAGGFPTPPTRRASPQTKVTRQHPARPFPPPNGSTALLTRPHTPPKQPSSPPQRPSSPGSASPQHAPDPPQSVTLLVTDCHVSDNKISHRQPECRPLEACQISCNHTSLTVSYPT